ncbi:hypothetical protein EV702DRAFT_1068685, partial [Suillus placidus]
VFLISHWLLFPRTPLSLCGTSMTLSVITKNVLSTFKFVNGSKEDPDMFGHVNYDSRPSMWWTRWDM